VRAGSAMLYILYPDVARIEMQRQFARHHASLL
jgi:hypothetical protein